VEGALGVILSGSFPLFLLGASLFLFATNTIGLLLATVARTMPQFGLLATPVFMVLVLLSGSVSPISAMPGPLQVLLKASPAVHFASLTTAILSRGAGFGVVWPQFVALAAIGAVSLAVALVRFRGMLAREA